MCEETIQAKDSVIVALSEKVEQTAPDSPFTDDILVEPFHSSVKVYPRSTVMIF